LPVGIQYDRDGNKGFKLAYKEPQYDKFGDCECLEGFNALRHRLSSPTAKPLLCSDRRRIRNQSS
jgi:hypothetical protein